MEEKLNNANSFEADFSCGIRTPYLQCLGQKHLECEMWGFWNIWIFILRHLFRDPRRNKKFISVFVHTACVFFMVGMLAFWLEVIRYGIFHLWIKLALNFWIITCSFLLWILDQSSSTYIKIFCKIQKFAGKYMLHLIYISEWTNPAWVSIRPSHVILWLPV